ncbi:MAG: heme d1 biosynthesis radical SAM protein NirJ [Candidatus Dadabacteria bacterium]|nr:MAG: heme d1 biosynthesis radical SAM protein NirJ [Candidatus Dadabacteria bacterium]
MFRISRYLHVAAGQSVPPHRTPSAPVVIWNLSRRCNLRCRHCYTVSEDRAYPGELSTAEALRTIEDLWQAGVRVLILSGGEPLLRPDIFELSEAARERGFYVALSTNGTAIDDQNIERIAAMEYSYVGISLDGIGARHDAFRGREGAFDQALRGLRLCRDAGIKTGIRYTLTELNGEDFPRLIDLTREEGIDKFYLSHLNYGGRGHFNRARDASFRRTRNALDRLFEAAWRDVLDGNGREYVTGNHDADAVYLLYWLRDRVDEAAWQQVVRELQAWGGNATGLHVANIDNLGNVHPDTFWWDENLGNVREQSFREIWFNPDHPLLQTLRKRPRELGGRCGACQWKAICNGSSRVRALRLTGDVLGPDPGCYLTDAETGIAGDATAAALPDEQRERDRAYAEVFRVGARS